MECCGKEDFSMELDCLTTKVFYFDFFFYVNYVVDGYCDRIVDISEIL